MPCVRVFTNVEAEKPAQIAFLKDVPCAQILLMSLGGLDADVNAKISGKVQALLTKHFKIASDHYYIQFCDCEGYMIGYDGMTF